MADWKETEVLVLWVLLNLAATSGSLALNLHYHCEMNHWKCLLMSNFVESGDVGGCREGALPRLPPASVSRH